jgi:hypothetical protein
MAGVRNRQEKSGFKLPQGVATPYLAGNRAWKGRSVTGNAFPVAPKDIEWLRFVCTHACLTARNIAFR